MIRRLDEALMRWTNEAYLWLLDRTGVYVASVFVVLAVLDMSWLMIGRGRDLIWLHWLWMVVGGLWGITRWHWQHVAMNGRFNDEVLRWRSGWVRRAGNVSMVVLSLPMFLGYGGGWRSLVGSAFWFSLSYLCCVLIRDREPKEFWYANTQTRTATEGAR